MIANLLFAAAGLTASSGTPPPNIIVFLVDDMGLMDTSLPFLTDSLGNPSPQPLNAYYHTPNMERMAKQGVRFSTFYAQSVSSPSRASLMTGQNATRHGTTNWINAETNNRNPYGPPEWNWQGVKSNTPTLPKMLQQAGYKTIHVGKAHFGCIGSEAENPVNIGFDVNIAGSAIGHPGSYYGEDGYGNIRGQKKRAVPGLTTYHGTDTFLTDALTMEAIKEIDKVVAEKRPFYLNMSHYAVHGPFMADKRFMPRYADSGKPKVAQAYATLIEGMDKSLGDIMDHLEKAGIAENTLIIFLGDNGGDAPLGGPKDCASSAPLRGMKGAEYEGGMRVPFIVSWGKPDSRNKNQKNFPVAKNSVQTQLGTIMDIYPTILSVIGCKQPEGYVLDGFNLKKQIAGEYDKEHPEKFLMHFPHDHRGSYFTAYRDGDWKLIYYYHPETPNAPSWVLYNLKADPTESNDLSASLPEKTLEMKKAMTEQLTKEGALYPVDKDGRALKPVL